MKIFQHTKHTKEEANDKQHSKKKKKNLGGGRGTLFLTFQKV
jgi:hypothetical protein